jgi:hypothetical protein
MLAGQVSNEVDFAADAHLVEDRSKRVDASAPLHAGEVGRNSKIVHGACGIGRSWSWPVRKAMDQVEDAD